MSSDLEALEAAADGLSAPLGPNSGLGSSAVFIEHLDNVGLSASGSACSRSPSFDPSECPQQSFGDPDVIALPQSEGEREWYSGVNLSGLDTDQRTGDASSSSGQRAGTGDAKDFMSSGLAFPPATV